MSRGDDPKAEDVPVIPPIFEEDIGTGFRRGTTHINDPVTRKLIAEMEAKRKAEDDPMPIHPRKDDIGIEL